MHRVLQNSIAASEFDVMEAIELIGMEDFVSDYLADVAINVRIMLNILTDFLINPFRCPSQAARSRKPPTTGNNQFIFFCTPLL